MRTLNRDPEPDPEKSRDDDLAHPDGLSPGSDVARQQRKRGGPVGRLDVPPQRVSAGQAGGRRRPVPEGAMEALPGRKSGLALAGLMLVIEEEARHVAILALPALRNI